MKTTARLLNTRTHRLPRHTLIDIVLILILSDPSRVFASDWPRFRGDSGRTAYSSSDLGENLIEVWDYQALEPSPAWPDPARGSYWQNLDRLTPRVVDDRAYNPVIASGRVLFGSSAIDALDCLDGETGTVHWTFTADGPIRYAPSVEDSRVVFGADDGVIRCLDLSDGQVLWSYAFAPESDWLAGNGRLISPVPVRTGLIVEGGLVYACAGLFPSEGVFAVALRLDDGSEVWRRDLNDQSPQGYLLTSDDELLVPTGRSTPFALDRSTGAMGRRFGGVGGTFAVVVEDQLVSGPGNDGSLATSDVRTGERLVTAPGRHLVVGPGHSYLIDGSELLAIDRIRLDRVRRELRSAQRSRREASRAGAGGDADLLARLDGQITALDSEMATCVLWRSVMPQATSMIGAGDRLIVGRAGRISLVDRQTGRVVQNLDVDDRVVGLAASDGLLVATTDRGGILGFASVGRGNNRRRLESTKRSVAERDPIRAEEATPLEDDDTLTSLLNILPTPRGYAVLVGVEDRGAIAELTRRTSFQIAVFHRDPETVAQLRADLRGRNLYGRRVSVHRLIGDRVPIVDASINAVWVDRSEIEMLARSEARRITAPLRGVLLYGDETPWRRPALEGAGAWTHMYADLGNTADGRDARISRDLALQWFGGPGPRRMIDRHLRGPSPLAEDGRLFIIGEDRLIGVDAYNGTELWDLELPESQRYGMPFDIGYIACQDALVYAAVDATCWRIDAESGHRLTQFGLPDPLTNDGLHWGYVGLDGPRLYGTACLPSAPRTVPSRAEIDQAYRSEQPLVTAQAVFAVDRQTGDRLWVHQGGVILHPTLCGDGRRLYFVEARGPDAMADAKGRIALPKLVEDLHLVALEADTGALAWEHRLDWPGARNILFQACRDGRLILTSSRDEADRDAFYEVRVLDARNGSPLWSASHPNGRPGALFHGEQVHHPVVLEDLLVAEPFIYHLADGRRFRPTGASPEWTLIRPGGGCGTISGSGRCLFFRASNPTLLDLSADLEPSQRFRTLGTNRAGCFINIVPAQGLVLVPEASASCVCNFPVQTSMAWRPRSEQGGGGD